MHGQELLTFHLIQLANRGIPGGSFSFVVMDSEEVQIHFVIRKENEVFSEINTEYGDFFNLAKGRKEELENLGWTYFHEPNRVGFIHSGPIGYFLNHKFQSIEELKKLAKTVMDTLRLLRVTELSTEDIVNASIEYQTLEAIRGMQYINQCAKEAGHELTEYHFVEGSPGLYFTKCYRCHQSAFLTDSGEARINFQKTCPG